MTVDEKWISVRSERDRLLVVSDYTQLADSPIADKLTWAAYRQALRDLPQTQNDPFNIVWPVAPG